MPNKNIKNEQKNPVSDKLNLLNDYLPKDINPQNFMI